MKTYLTILFLLLSNAAFSQVNVTHFDMVVGSAGSSPKATTIYNGKLYFSTNLSKLAYTDGSSTPVELTFGNDPVLGGSEPFDRFAVIKNKLYYSTGPAANGTVFEYDGVNPPSVAFQPVNENPTDPWGLTALNDQLYFGSDSYIGKHFWRLDPSTKIAILPDAINNGEAYFLTPFNNKLYYNGRDTNGYGLFSYDPATDKIKKVPNTGLVNINPVWIYPYDGKLFMASATYRKLYCFDGMDLKPITPDSSMLYYVTIANPIAGLYGSIYFAGRQTTKSAQLYKYDIKSGKTSLVYQINSSGDANPQWFITYGNKLYFSATNGINGAELWVYDGVSNPTMIADINPGSAGSNVSFPVVFNNSLFFTATEPTNGAELYKLTDPVAGISNVKFSGDVSVSPNPSPGQFEFVLELKKSAQLDIIISDIAGKQIYRHGSANYDKGRNVINISLSELNSGCYYYQIIDDKGIKCFVGKVIKN